MTAVVAQRPPQGKLRRLGKWLGAVLAFCLVLSLGFWAGRVAFEAASADPPPVVERTAVEVVAGTVGRSVTYGVIVEPQQKLVAVNQLQGTVTGIDHSNGSAITNGDTLFWVSGIPVRAIQSPVPFYRNLIANETGEDVQALQQALLDLEHLTDPSRLTGKYDPTTVAAVKKWQQALGIARSGTISAGELLAVPDLQGNFSLAAEVQVGLPVTSYQEVLHLQADPEFLIRLSPNENSELLPGMAVQVQYGEHTWNGELAAEVRGDSSGDTFLVSGAQGAVLCGADCADLLTETSGLGRAIVEVVAEVSGPAVPVAALRSTPAGGVYVELLGAGTAEVTVLGADRGLAVVDGLSVGQQVVLDE